MSCVVQILVAPAPDKPMAPLKEVRAVPGQGLEGDRYFMGGGTFSPKPHRPDFEITLIEQEQVEAFAKAYSLPFTSLQARRNIVTSGVALNDLVGKEFSIGQVRLRGIRLCEPCNHLAKLTFAETLRGLVHKAGLRAQILSEGMIRVGDPLQVESPIRAP